ncbi:MAG: type II toxin-antitoxin system VapB family antitoxin [Ardenticatenales bacterium]|nr:type II toxin-antitoxin system VapB family antitoxin [Ardenticatenales bacterium]MCC7020366.1 type II toxin-antitoxin system VapB family antitoxin [Ardenticatenales bacterium]
MALNIKNERVERLVAEVAGMTGETKVEAVRRALEERKARLVLYAPAGDPFARAMRIMEREIWPAIPAAQLGRRLSRDEEDAILGYGPEGV